MAVLAIDPTRKKTGGALLGDRIRMNFIDPDRVFMRSLATRDSRNELTISIRDSIAILRAAGFDLIIVETPGIGQGDNTITDFCDLSVYVMTSEYGAPSQLEKIDMLDFADLVVLNKFDHKNSMDALRDIRKQYRRNHDLFEAADEDLPDSGDRGQQFQRPGTGPCSSRASWSLLKKKKLADWEVPAAVSYSISEQSGSAVIPTERENYLWDIAGVIQSYHRETDESVRLVKRIESLREAGEEVGGAASLQKKLGELEEKLDPEIRELTTQWRETRASYER